MEALRAKLDKKSLEQMKKWEDLMENLIDDDSSWLNPQNIERPSEDDKELKQKEFWDGLDSIEKKIQTSLKLHYHQMVDYQTYN